jgi:short-subunit dehydrogenase
MKKEVNLDKTQYKKIPTKRSKNLDDALSVLEERLTDTQKTLDTAAKPMAQPDLFDDPTTWQKRVVVITGASSGIGFATAHKFSLYADVVYNLSREKGEDENINFIETDISNPEEIKDAIRKIIHKEGQIDILINNAAVGISGPVEELLTTDIVRVINTNFLGTITAAQAVIPFMREARKGTIINISCVSAGAPAPFTGIYTAVKTAVENFSASLRKEIKPCKINIITLLASNIKTNFTENRIKQESNNKIYKYRMSKSIGKIEYAEQNGISAEAVAETIYKLSNKKYFIKPIKVIGTANKIKLFFRKFAPRQ